MADNHSPEPRRFNMSQIRGTNTNAEIKVRRYLFSQGFRYRKNVKTLPGKPDIVLKKYNSVIFVHGCFWHKHECARFKWPKTNRTYWTNKLQRNVERDKDVNCALTDMGWKVITIWECDLRTKTFHSTMQRVINVLNKAKG